MARSRETKIELTAYDDLFQTDESREEAKLSKIRDIPISEIDEFPDHPFKVLMDEDMEQLVESIKRNGVMTPATVRLKEDGRYELISGHRRKKACELAGLETLKCEVKELTRDEAIIVMVESNLQRSVYRQFNTPWYAVKKFGRSSHTGNNVRQEKIYKMISQLKWQILMEIRKTYSVRFWDDGIFTPTFETYSTNIRPSNERRNLEFWDSISFDRVADYAPTYNACVCWDYKHGENEGIRLSAFCGGNYSRDDHLPEIAHHDISDIYGVYLTAATLEYVADRDIAICNKKISKVIRKTKTSSVLKVRVAVERKLYYCYRFISEFSGKSIDHDDVKAFRHQFYKKGSVSSRSLEGISKRIKETKVQIDNILKLLNDAAEYRSSESNIKLQWIMMIVTILSLFVALYSIKNGDVINEIKNLIEWIKTHSGLKVSNL